MVNKSSFVQLAKKRTMEWISFSREAWEQAKGPHQLEPYLVFDTPINYGFEVYSWQEKRFKNDFRVIFRKTDSTSPIINGLGKTFADYWSKYYDRWSIWKQLRPFFIFSSELGSVTKLHKDLAIAYILAQGVPSMAIDYALDTNSRSFDKEHLSNLLPFCLTSYIKGIELIRHSGAPSVIEDILLMHTKQMYDLMWREHENRYIAPSNTTQVQLQHYVSGESRILSSVFYSIAVEWAFILADKTVTNQVRSACIALRKVRQLNDEIIDLEDDFRNGIITFPLLSSLTSRRYKKDTLQLIKSAWDNKSTYNVTNNHINQLNILVRKTGGLFYTASKSLDQLMASANYIMGSFEPKNAFEITLLINQRLSTLIKRANNDWWKVIDHYNLKYI